MNRKRADNGTFIKMFTEEEIQQHERERAKRWYNTEKGKKARIEYHKRYSKTENGKNIIRQANRKFKKKYQKRPWVKTYRKICNRLRPNNNDPGALCYKKLGIKRIITISQLKFLWERDQAYLLRQPSIDRINPLGDYTLENCRYIELVDNVRRQKVKTMI